MFGGVPHLNERRSEFPAPSGGRLFGNQSGPGYPVQSLQLQASEMRCPFPRQSQSVALFEKGCKNLSFYLEEFSDGWQAWFASSATPGPSLEENYSQNLLGMVKTESIPKMFLLACFSQKTLLSPARGGACFALRALHLSLHLAWSD